MNNLARESKGDPSLLFELASAYQKIGDVQGTPSRGSALRYELTVLYQARVWRKLGRSVPACVRKFLERP